MKKGIVIRLYPNNEQKELLNKMFGCVRKVYNYFLDYATTNKDYNYNEWSKLLTELKNSNDYSYLKECDKFGLQNSLKNLKSAFNNFFNKRSKYPSFKSRRNQCDSYRTNYTNNNIDLLDKHIKLPKLGLVKCKYNKEINNIKIINVTIKKNGSIYEASIIYEEEIVQYDKTNNVVGIDLGVRKLVTTSDNEKYISSLDLLKIENKIRKAQKKLSKKKKDSKNYIKQKNKLNKIYRYKKNYTKDIIHKVTTKLVKEYDIIFMEDINIKDLLDKQDLKSKRKKMLSSCLGKIREYLEYKVVMHDKKLVKIDKYYASSKICSRCSSMYEVKDNEIYCCPECGNIIDRDYNAAINILNRGLALTS